LAGARDARSADFAHAAALCFAWVALRGIGHVLETEQSAVLAAGFGDTAMMGIIAVLLVNLFSNAVNHLASTEPDAWYQRVDESI